MIPRRGDEARRPVGFPSVERPATSDAWIRPAAEANCPACGESGALLEQVAPAVWYCQVCRWSGSFRRAR